jgi:hypothetical protein
LKAQNIYIKPLLKPENTYNKPCFETVYLGQNEINLLKQKVAQNVTISLGYFIFSKNHISPLKFARLAKNCPIWSPCSLALAMRIISICVALPKVAKASKAGIFMAQN